MENGIEVFKNEQFGEIRTIIDDGKVLFCGSDIAKALGYSNPRKAVRDHTKGGTKRSIGVETGKNANGSAAVQMVEMAFISEGDVYRLIVRSKMPSAEKFESWVFDEVLPTIRKSGGYIDDTEKLVETYFGDVNIYQKGIVKALFDNAKSMQDKINRLTSEAETNKPLVDFANHVGLLATSNSNVNMQTMAKLLCDNGINIGRNRLFEILRKNKILMERNIPYQQYVDRGYFLVKESIVDKGNTTGIIQTTLVTPKGQLWVQNKIEAWMNNESEVSNG